MLLKPIEISARIRLLMKQMQLTQRGLAEQLNISQPAVSQYLQGRVPPPEVLWRLSRLSGRSLEWILTGESASGAPRVHAPPAVYGQEAVLLTLWSRLPAEVRRNLLALMRQMAASEKGDVQEKVKG